MLNFKNKKIQRYVSSFLVISILLPSLFFFFAPKKAEAIVASTPVAEALSFIGNLLTGSSGVSNATTAAKAVQTWYQVILTEVLRAVARKVLQQITKSTVNWINGGFHGSPLFLENSSSFFTDIVKTEVKTLVDQFGYDPARFPFGRDFALNTINAYKRTLDNNASYTLSQAMSPIQATNFRNNFNVGGWNGFLINTQYPQNNYLGFQMLANEELARRVSSSPGVNNAITKVKETLQQGAGFLSPQTCPSNSAYNNGYNEFNRPAFSSSSWMKSNKPPEQPNVGSEDNPSPADQILIDNYYTDVNTWNDLKTTAEETWKQDNTCPKGLVATTPGSVVSSQITTALGSQFRSTELGAAMGNSLSAIFDALLNKLLDEGLNALASTTNPQPSPDTWTYGGPNGPISLDSNGSGSSDPFAGFDEVVVLKDFKKLLDGYFIGTCTLPGENVSDAPVELNDVPEADCKVKETKGSWAKNPAGEDYIPGDIARTKEELALMDNTTVLLTNDQTGPDPLHPGIVQLAKNLKLQTKALDQCLPGPDKSWDLRLKDEEGRLDRELTNASSEGDNLKKSATAEVIKELKFAVTLFNDWINTNMMYGRLALPGSILYMDAVKAIDDLPQQVQETVDAVRAKSQTFARMQAIKIVLDGITKIDPSTGEPLDPTDEDKVISSWKQYKALQALVSSAISIENTRKDLDILKGKSLKLLDTKNTSDPKDDTGLIPQCIAERAAKGWGPADANGMGGGILSAVGSTSGTELEQFCSIPIFSGYSHGHPIRNDSSVQIMNCTGGDIPGNPPTNTISCENKGGSEIVPDNWFIFRNSLAVGTPATLPPSGYDLGSPGYINSDLPLVNAFNVYGDETCTGLCSWGSFADILAILTGSPPPIYRPNIDDKKISININCRIVFKARDNDYTNAGDVSNY